ncbi:mitogen-activated protein kinase 12-like isoform X2 [Dysidea avara]|uniref:mitogen-activated protein kinase 12-like isoform X2 n=1 Tax=Dysidea avara TaxID=196820 RepID=UPI00331F484E
MGATKTVTSNRVIPIDIQLMIVLETQIITELVAMSTSAGYSGLTYPVLIGNAVRVCSTNEFANLPHHDHFMVKERIRDSSGIVKARLTLRCSTTKRYGIDKPFASSTGFSKPLHYEYGEPMHHRENCTNPGYVVFTCEGIFNGSMKYPLPTRRAANNRIGKGGNGFVFIIYHSGKEYAVKKTVYRANEVNVHSALRHENILPLVAVLMGERHEHHSRKFYCFHFMPKMDCDLRQIMSTKEVGCLKHFHTNCVNDPRKWEIGFSNIKFILGETLKALTYLHDNGYVHRDVKGLGIKEPTDQMIKFASILPLGTPGYRAPEVSMHITVSGPYEKLYTFAVDMWSFGCLCLNICIGKTAALRQREEASLLLSRTHQCSKELWEKTTKIKELENALPFLHENDFTNLVKGCLQVNSAERPSAKEALAVFT